MKWRGVVEWKGWPITLGAQGHMRSEVFACCLEMMDEMAAESTEVRKLKYWVLSSIEHTVMLYSHPTDGT